MSRPTRRLKSFLPIQGYHLLLPTFPCCSSFYFKAIGLVRVRSSLLTESLLMSFPSANEIFQFTEFASHGYVFTIGYLINQGGFSHSEISGSKSIHNSPELIAVYYVLHRLLTPRHPPNALILFSLPLNLRLHDACRVNFARFFSI